MKPHQPRFHWQTDASGEKWIYDGETPVAAFFAGYTGAEPMASHLPFILDENSGEHGLILGHMAKANRICTATDNNIPVDPVLEGNLHLISHLAVGGKDKVVENVAEVDKLDATVSYMGTELVLEPGLQRAVAEHVGIVLADLVGVEIVLRCTATEVVKNKAVDEVGIYRHGRNGKDRFILIFKHRSTS